MAAVAALRGAAILVNLKLPVFSLPPEKPAAESVSADGTSSSTYTQAQP
jgi:hypothetical protein